jgi:hypothetical protein
MVDEGPSMANPPNMKRYSLKKGKTPFETTVNRYSFNYEKD